MKRLSALLLALSLYALLLTSCTKNTVILKQEPENSYGVGLEIEVGKSCNFEEIVEVEIKVTSNAPEIKNCAVRASSRHFVTGFIDGYAKINEDSEYVHTDLKDGFTTKLYLYLPSRLNDGMNGDIKIYTVGDPKTENTDITTAIYLHYEVRDQTIFFSQQ